MNLSLFVSSFIVSRITVAEEHPSVCPVLRPFLTGSREQLAIKYVNLKTSFSLNINQLLNGRKSALYGEEAKPQSFSWGKADAQLHTFHNDRSSQNTLHHYPSINLHFNAPTQHTREYNIMIRSLIILKRTASPWSKGLRRKLESLLVQ
jgi:hypothetical protein